MRGFAFTIDMAFAALLVIAVITFFSQSFHPIVPDSHLQLQLHAKDAAMEWFYSHPDAQPTIPIPTGADYACSNGFRPIVTTDLLDPNNNDSWVLQTECVISP